MRFLTRKGCEKTKDEAIHINLSGGGYALYRVWPAAGAGCIYQQYLLDSKIKKESCHRVASLDVTELMFDIIYCIPLCA